MHVGVKLEYDKSSALELPAFEPEEIDFWLNNAILKFTKTRYSGMNVKGTSFEQTQKRTDDLRTLVVTVDLLPFGNGSFPNSTQFEYPSTDSFISSPNYLFTLQEETTIAVDGVSSGRVGVTECTLDEYSAMIADPFSEHILHYGTAKPLRIYNNNVIEIIDDGNYSITYYHISYIKVPATVALSTATDCDLPEHTHDEIVKMAANMMLENVEQPRYRTHANELNTME